MGTGDDGCGGAERPQPRGGPDTVGATSAFGRKAARVKPPPLCVGAAVLDGFEEEVTLAAGVPADIELGAVTLELA